MLFVFLTIVLYLVYREKEKDRHRQRKSENVNSPIASQYNTLTHCSGPSSPSAAATPTPHLPSLTFNLSTASWVFYLFIFFSVRIINCRLPLFRRFPFLRNSVKGAFIFKFLVLFFYPWAVFHRKKRKFVKHIYNSFSNFIHGYASCTSGKPASLGLCYWPSPKLLRSLVRHVNNTAHLRKTEPIWHTRISPRANFSQFFILEVDTN